MNKEIINPAPDCQIISSRNFDFHIEKVFKAWTDPAHLQNWWGPKGFTNTFEEFDLRPGGHWKFIMHGPEKGNYRNECVFTRIEPPVLLSWYRLTQPLFSIIASFEESGISSTRVVFRMIFDTPEASNKIRPFAIEKNEQNFDRLEVELGKM
jgi:uncharacterized protein YndB with AHSA1/START domain